VVGFQIVVAPDKTPGALAELNDIEIGAGGLPAGAIKAGNLLGLWQAFHFYRFFIQVAGTFAFGLDRAFAAQAPRDVVLSKVDFGHRYSLLSLI
jgi:hypothetical protein